MIDWSVGLVLMVIGVAVAVFVAYAVGLRVLNWLARKVFG